MRTHMTHGPRSTAVLGMTLLALFACNDDPVAPPEPEGALPESAPQESAPLQDVVLVAAPNTWAGKKAMPTARSQLVAVTVNNIIYAIGGAGSSLTALRTVQAYNPATNSWSTKAQLPSGRRAQTGASSIGNKIYVAGGFNTSAALTKTLYVYDVAANTWTKKADMPTVGSCGGQGVINNLLYVYVGCTGVPFGDKLLRYTPSTNKWTTLAAPPHQHASGAAGAIGTKFYLAGGSDDGALDHRCARRLQPGDQYLGAGGTDAHASREHGEPGPRWEAVCHRRRGIRRRRRGHDGGLRSRQQHVEHEGVDAEGPVRPCGRDRQRPAVRDRRRGG